MFKTLYKTYTKVCSYSSLELRQRPGRGSVFWTFFQLWAFKQQQQLRLLSPPTATADRSWEPSQSEQQQQQFRPVASIGDNGTMPPPPQADSHQVGDGNIFLPPAVTSAWIVSLSLIGCERDWCAAYPNAWWYHPNAGLYWDGHRALRFTMHWLQNHCWSHLKLSFDFWQKLHCVKIVAVLCAYYFHVNKWILFQA